MMIMGVKVPWYNVTSLNKWVDVEHLVESIEHGTLIYFHCQ
jgi:hypothetical protein